MKRILASLILLWTTSLYAVESTSVDVVMSIEELSIETIKVLDAIASPAGQSRVINGRTVVRNLSNTNVDFNLHIASTTGSWTPSENMNEVDINRYRLMGAFAVHNATITSADFGDDDIITTLSNGANAVEYWSQTADVSDVGTSALNGGFNVGVEGLADNERHLFVRFDAGAVGTTGSAIAYLNVGVTATQ